jgi:hypothetical protein
MTRFASLALMALVASAGTARADMFDGMLDRLGKAVDNRTQQLGEKAINGTYDHADKAVACTVGDKACEARASEAAKEAKPATAAAPAAAAPSDVAKCTASDTTCLQAAGARGQKVEIVSESDTMSCRVTDTACLQQAQKLGKKVAVVQ